MAHGYFIALEGIDGAGTTSQLRLLADALRMRGYGVTTTAEPSAGPAGKLLRQALAGKCGLTEATMALLFAADRLHHVAESIAPALARGHVVLCDRYLLSSYAYQGAALPLAWVQQINAQAPPPDVYLFFRVDPDTAAKRRQARGGAADRFETLARQRVVATAYEDLLLGPLAWPEVCVLDAAQPLQWVTDAAMQVIEALLGRRGGHRLAAGDIS